LIFESKILFINSKMFILLSTPDFGPFFPALVAKPFGPSSPCPPSSPTSGRKWKLPPPPSLAGHHRRTVRLTALKHHEESSRPCHLCSPIELDAPSSPLRVAKDFYGAPPTTTVSPSPSIHLAPSLPYSLPFLS
jgi:hypothetical protein